jgi:predicted phosphodiesterase
MSVIFYGDPHGTYEPLFEAVSRHRPDAVILLGDMGLEEPLPAKLAPLTVTNTRWFWIHGNHDAGSPEVYDFLFTSPGNLNRRAATVGGGITVAGLGGHYKGKVWNPKEGGEAPRWATRDDFLREQGRGGRFRGGMPLGQIQTIFQEDHAELRRLTGVDVLVTHEAPTSIGGDMGFGGIDDLARDMAVKLVIHGHHHHSYTGKTRDGIAVRGLGIAEPWLMETPDQV